MSLSEGFDSVDSDLNYEGGGLYSPSNGVVNGYRVEEDAEFVDVAVCLNHRDGFDFESLSKEDYVGLYAGLFGEMYQSVGNNVDLENFDKDEVVFEVRDSAENKRFIDRLKPSELQKMNDRIEWIDRLLEEEFITSEPDEVPDAYSKKQEIYLKHLRENAETTSVNIMSY